MSSSQRALSLVVILALCLQACAAWKPLPSSSTLLATDCENLFEEMDRHIADYDVADAGTARISGFLQLRNDRFLASFATDNLTGDAYGAWLERLRQLDMSARQIEWRNLPPEANAQLEAAFGANVETALNICGHILTEQALIYPRRRSQLLSAIEPPDAYSTWQRFLGFYFFTRWAIVEGIRREQQVLRESFTNAAQDHAVTDRLIRYAPPTSEALELAETAKILEQSARNPLGVPEPSADQLRRLFSAFAPVWAVETASDSDHIGTVRIGADGDASLDVVKPVVYTLKSHTRFGDQVLLQLNYVIWFPARAAEAWLDIYAGRFDGLIWRVTLGMDGKPLAYDSIHSCGCYYQIFPGEGGRVEQPRDGSEPILSPMPIPGLKASERLTVRLSSGKHFIRGVVAEKPTPESMVYGWRDYNELRSLPTPDGRHLSLFDADGLVAGSERLERFLFWPMGVPNAGAMRQWGTHAIAFLGKRHFDDPRLMEKLLRPLGN
ncbi:MULTISPECIES: hypothetical protein [Methylomonas]|uniref:Uncharacterized protein n=2 Tax=Methylomonas TaxID=416 RepID=A0A140E5B9_9GAMM|nr:MULTISPECIES: hypothetical protein [Methylomonas]AMK75593.1 hypothetical protein JT25_003670 [Methylomonas denitrificans]OAI09208.1 hypothetical protein A1342_08425 [Methylomonas methanica]TCV79090.1 hypothetical protein EDE11_12267 [Methylomonas methanica]